MKPPFGRYRLTWGTPPHEVTYRVEPDGIHTTFGLLAWNEAGGAFFHGDPTKVVAIECTGVGTFVAVYGTTNITGTCAYLGP